MMEKIVENLLCYSVNSKGIILSIDGQWDYFANSNDENMLNVKDVVGKNLFKFINGDGVCNIYKNMHEIILKDKNRVITFDYRCDSNKIKRYMKMEIFSQNNNVIYRSFILKEECFKTPVLVKYDIRGKEFIIMCSWCKDFLNQCEPVEWKKIDIIFDYLPESYTITHSICPVCMKNLDKEFTKFF